MNDEVEIGPGLFASFNNFHVKLRQAKGTRVETIYLGPAARAKLARYFAELAEETASPDRE